MYFRNPYSDERGVAEGAADRLRRLDLGMANGAPQLPRPVRRHPAGGRGDLVVAPTMIALVLIWDDPASGVLRQERWGEVGHGVGSVWRRIPSERVRGVRVLANANNA